MALLICGGAMAGDNVFSVRGDQLLLNERPFKVIGLRCSNALISDATTQQLLDHLDVFRSYGVNTVSVFFMGSRFGDVKGYRADASLDPVYAERMGRIIEAADARDMVVLVGCLYWSTSRAKEDLVGVWDQTAANRAVANTVKWLAEQDYRNVFVDVDNEGMAHDATGWSIASMIDAAHAADPTIMVAYNDGDPAPPNADLYVHHSPKVPGKPWLDSESTPPAKEGYWGRYSKHSTMETDGSYYNYSRIGRYTPEMKEAQIGKTREGIEQYNGIMLASTWLQCAPNEGIGGPFHTPGGRSGIQDVDKDIDVLHPDAGILWWLEYVRDTYGTNGDPQPQNARFLEREGELCIEAEHKAGRLPSTYSAYKAIHTWELQSEVDGFSGQAYMAALPDEWPDGQARGVSSPRDNSGAQLVYPIKVQSAGKYFVFVRGYSMGGESNGVHLGLNGTMAGRDAGASNISGFRPHGQWVWESGRKDGFAAPATLELAAGNHVLCVWNRDDGFRLDKIVLRLKNEKPEGMGPSESELQ
jgi:hypothetical protein